MSDYRMNSKERKRGCCRVCQFQNETGDGTMTVYDVFPGVELIYNDFHMNWYDSDYIPNADLFCIDHCREGRLEYSAKDDAYSYAEAGDLKFDRRLSHTGKFQMPLSHYHGITVSADMKIAEKSLHEEIKNFFEAVTQSIVCSSFSI